MKNPNMHFGEKAKEILIEVLIIVFAVTFAAMIERTREHYKEKSEARDFVLVLKGDLANEINQMEDSKSAMNTTRKNYTMVKQLKTADIDSLEKKHLEKKFNIAAFNTHIINGRYDGFKSSGKIQTIENDSLRNDILKFYQEDVPYVDFTENSFNDNQKRLSDLLIGSSDSNSDKPIDLFRVLTSSRAKLILQLSLGYGNAVTASYDQAIAQAKKVEAEIDEESLF